MQDDDDVAGAYAGRWVDLEPDDDWRSQSQFGCQRRDSTNAGRLVRMGDLVRWLMRTRELPRRAAVEALRAAIEPAVMSSLYWLRDDDYAVPVEADCMFGLATRAQAEVAQARKNQQALESAYKAYIARGGHDAPPRSEAVAFGYSDSLPAGSFSEPGAAALRRRLLADWVPSRLSIRTKRQSAIEVDSLDDERSVIARLAITVQAAHELLGYGVAIEKRAQLERAGATVVVLGAAVVEGAAPTVVEPDGGKWPHKTGDEWTEAKRAAMFLMRHRYKVSDADLERIVSAKRQTINRVIGGKRPSGGLAAIQAESNGWRPSAELLRQCGEPLQALQIVTATIAP